MKKIFLLLLLSILCFAFKTSEDYKTYCNDRFDFCIKYPSSFILQEKSDNGDGAFFISVDKKAEIWSYGALAVEPLDKLDYQFKIATGDIKITYQLKKNIWFVFSGTDKNGNIVYQKTMKKNIDYLGDKGTPAFQTIRLIFPPGQKEHYAEYCKMISKSF